MDLLFGADDQIAQPDDLLKPLRHGGTHDEPILATVSARQPPEYRPIIDIEHHAAAGLLDDLGRGAACRIHRWLR